MELAATLKSAAAVVTSVGIIGGGAYVLDERHFPRDSGERMQSASRVSTILELVDIAHREGRQQWICRALDEEFISLCTEQPKHYLCIDPEAKAQLLGKAGCN